MALDIRKPKNYRRAWRGGVNLMRLVTVCDACIQASCWHGKFYCERFRTAGTKELTLAELHQLNREHPSYWFTNPATDEIDHEGLDAFIKEYPQVQP